MKVLKKKENVKLLMMYCCTMAALFVSDFPRQDSNDTAELKYPYSQRFPKNGQPNKSQENEELNDVPNR